MIGYYPNYGCPTTYQQRPSTTTYFAKLTQSHLHGAIRLFTALSMSLAKIYENEEQNIKALATIVGFGVRFPHKNAHNMHYY